jgi:hypothetical protein
VQSKYILLISATKIVENLPIFAHFLIICAVNRACFSFVQMPIYIKGVSLIGRFCGLVVLKISPLGIKKEIFFCPAFVFSYFCRLKFINW